MPPGGPLLLSCNHPMAFSEACLLACFLERPLHFLVRGDVFKPGWVWFFNGTNQIPIYRFRDGFSNMRRNAESFSRAHQALKDGKVIMIFPEGNTRMQKKLSPLQKGAARLAFGAYSEKQVDDIRILPVGVNYSDGKSFRSDVMIKIGDPLRLADYINLYESDLNEGVRSLTADLYQSMLPLVIHIDKSEDEKLANKIFSLYGFLNSDSTWPILDKSESRFDMEKKIAKRINALSEPAKSDLLKLTAHPYVLTNKRSGKNYFMLAISLPIAVIGFVLNAIPFYLAKYIADMKIRQVEFYSPVRMGLMLVFYQVWLLIFFILLAVFFGWYALFAIWILPLSGFVTILWKEGFDKSRDSRTVNQSILRKIEDILAPGNSGE